MIRKRVNEAGYIANDPVRFSNLSRPEWIRKHGSENRGGDSFQTSPPS